MAKNQNPDQTIRNAVVYRWKPRLTCAVFPGIWLHLTCRKYVLSTADPVQEKGD